MQDSSDSLYRSPSSSPTKARRMRRVSLEPTPVYKNLSKKWKIRNPSEEYLLKRRYSEPNPVPTLEECLINFNLACQDCAVDTPGQCRCSISEPQSPTNRANVPPTTNVGRISPSSRTSPYPKKGIEEDSTPQLPPISELFHRLETEQCYDNVSINRVLSEEKHLTTLTSRFFSYQSSKNL